MKGDEPGPEAQTAAQAAAYIADVAAHLAQVATRQNLNTLAYLLDMVRLEAISVNHSAGRQN
jgi:hypothetical protein